MIVLSSLLLGLVPLLFLVALLSGQFGNLLLGSGLALLISALLFGLQSSADLAPGLPPVEAPPAPQPQSFEQPPQVQLDGAGV